MLGVPTRHRPEHRSICRADLKRFYGREIEACDGCPLISNGCACLKLDVGLEKCG
jgi:hypothetical protein